MCAGRVRRARREERGVVRVVRMAGGGGKGSFIVEGIEKEGERGRGVEVNSAVKEKTWWGLAPMVAQP